MRYYNLILIFTFFCNLAYAQNQRLLDSLTHVYNTCNTDTHKVLMLRKIAYLYSDNNNSTKAFEYGKKALNLALKTKNDYHIYRSYLGLGIFSNNIGKPADALYYYTQTLNYFEPSNNPSDACFMYTRIAGLYTSLENYKKAYEYYDKAIDLISPTKDSLLKLQIMMPKLTTYVSDKKYNEARKLLSYMDSLGSKSYKEWNAFQKLYIYENLWLIDINEKKLNDALKVAKQSLKLAEESKNKEFTISSKSLLAKTYFELKDLNNAYSYTDGVIKECLIIEDYNQLMEHYVVLADIWIERENYQEAKLSLSKALRIAREGDVISSKIEILKKLSLVTENLSEPKDALIYFKEAISLEDSITNNKSQNIIAEIQTRTETEQKQKEIEILNKDKKLASTQLENEKAQKFYLYGGLALVIFFGIFMYNRFRITNKQKQIIENQKIEVENAKHIVEEKHKEITDSINYAERIQRSFLATKELLDINLKNYFLFFKPKDVVSGDFYWASKLSNNYFALAIADSTGHGVPGAIMSLLNVTSLEKAIEHHNNPAEILDHTRQTIIERLKKDGSAEGGKDGMDCILMVFDFANRQLQIAAANNPVWIIRENNLIEIKPDKMPVGKSERQQTSFTLHSVEIQTGDTIYTLTDGFPDQFGGPNGKKFMSKKLKELLLANTTLPMSQQKQLLETTFKNWVGDLEQVDDVCVIGIKI